MSGEEKIKKDKSNDTEETITLQLVDGKWKVVYADLMYYSNVNQGMPTTTVTIEY